MKKTYSELIKYYENASPREIIADMYFDYKEEIERLDNIIKQQDTRNSRQRIANRKLLERNQDLVIENLKLNNIINEIYTKANDTNITSLDLRDYILNNLGVDKE